MISKYMKSIKYFISCVCLCGASLLAVDAQPLAGKEYRWAWTGWERPAGVNPIISPNANSVFYCPMKNTFCHRYRHSYFSHRLRFKR